VSQELDPSVRAQISTSTQVADDGVVEGFSIEGNPHLLMESHNCLDTLDVESHFDRGAMSFDDSRFRCRFFFKINLAAVDFRHFSSEKGR
jgi:hypothetical protein